MLLLQNPDPIVLAGIVIGLVTGITFHEFTHAFIANQLGDHMPRALGRVSLNPLRHLDPLGTVMLVLVGMGWGRPVPVNPAALRPGRRGMALVAAGGPVANVVVGVVLSAGVRVLVAADLTGPVAGVLFYAVYVNLLLAMLNLIPIPPLDGYNVVLAFVPPRWIYPVQRYANYGVLVLVALLVLPGSPLRLLLGLALPWATLLVGL